MRTKGIGGLERSLSNMKLLVLLLFFAAFAASAAAQPATSFSSAGTARDSARPTTPYSDDECRQRLI